ncbi:PstS family phosphate ABC transporter substrate-binding protein [Salipaludibacillus sp. HK11]|uniref:PstS family phosphate ABC transporter substrate-binding protein n=1 Tax=Salipaludibacillus sp. HK11 TaxID=3394320 RepID=UPI0039FC90BB
MVGLMAFTVACGEGENEASGNTGESNNNADNNSANEESDNEKNSSDEDTGELEGEIAIDGSSTVFPIMEAVSEEFNLVQPGIRASVGVSGTGGGFKRFTIGETDISNASRPIKEEEIAIAEENGIEYIELELAYDGLSVVINPENDFVDYLTVDELKMMWIEGNGVETWKDIRDEWPDEEIEFYSPGHDSGTYDYWNEVILNEEEMRRDAQLSEDDNVLVNGVAGGENGLGYFGYAYYIENKDKLKIVPIDNGDGAVEPTDDTVNDGSYAPLSRPIYTYVNKESIKEDHLYEYLKFMNENVGDLALEVGYVNATDESYENNLEKIEAER